MAEVVDWPGAPRRRPGMFVGSTGPAGAARVVFELVANCVDRFLAGDLTRVTVNIEHGMIEVSDDGPGLAFDEPGVPPTSSLAEEHLTRPHRTPSADGHAPHVHLTQLGAGLALVNALSAEMHVVSHRHGIRWEQRFAKGFATSSPTHTPAASGEGTTIRLRLDSELFESTQLPVAVIRHRLFEAAHLFAGLHVELGQERFVAGGGLGDLIYSFGVLPWWACPPVAALAGIHDDVAIQFAASDQMARTWKPDRKATQWHSWANGVGTPEHGHHVAGAVAALDGLGWKPATAMIHVVLLEPEWAGPTRGRLVASHAADAVKVFLHHHLERFLDSE